MNLGRDITMRNSKQFRGISMDTDDDFGKPPFRTLPQMLRVDAAEAEYVMMWRDHYLEKGLDDSGSLDFIVAYLTEFLEETKAAALVWNKLTTEQELPKHGNTLASSCTTAICAVGVLETL